MMFYFEINNLIYVYYILVRFYSVLKSFEQKLNVTEEKIISKKKQNQLCRNEKKNKNKSD